MVGKCKYLWVWCFTNVSYLTFSVIYCYLQTHDLLEADPISIIHNSHCMSKLVQHSSIHHCPSLQGESCRSSKLNYMRLKCTMRCLRWEQTVLYWWVARGGVMFLCPDWCSSRTWMLAGASVSLMLIWCLVLVEFCARTCQRFTCLVASVWLQHKSKPAIWLRAETSSYTLDKDCKYLMTETSIIIVVAVCKEHNIWVKLIWFLLPSNTTLYFSENNQLGYMFWPYAGVIIRPLQCIEAVST
jgi:hypothetical protein